MLYKTRLAGFGDYLPDNVMFNDHEVFSKMGLDNDWIVKRTGINKRHIASENQASSDLASIAGQRALDNASCSRPDLIIVATCTPDLSFPSTAALTQDKMGLAGVPAFDINATCAGFLYGMVLVDSLIKSGAFKKVLLIGSEVCSRSLDWEDKKTSILFGDGAAAFLMEAVESNKADDNLGIIGYDIKADGSKSDFLISTGGVSGGNNDIKNVLKMKGLSTFNSALSCINESSTELLQRLKMQISDIDWMVSHQGNYRILLESAKTLGIPMEKVIATINEHANTSSASIPLAFSKVASDGVIKRGDTILFTAIGSGLVWGSLVMRF